MFKRLQTAVALAILTTTSVFAANHLATGDFSGMQIPTGVAEKPSIEAALQAQVNGEAVNADALQTLVAKYAGSEAVEMPEVVAFEQPVLLEDKVSEESTAVTTGAARKARPARAPKLKTGSLIAKDLSYTTGKTIGYPITLEQVDASDASQGYRLINLYNTGDTITLSINTETGVVSIPSQLVYTSSTYGDFSIVGITKTDTGYSYSRNAIEGTLDENGHITLNPWALMVTTEGSYFGRCAIIAQSSEWQSPNAHATAIDMTSGDTVTYDFLIEQTGEQGVKLYGYFHPGTVELTGRISSSKTLSISSQLIYTNAFYGAFNNFPATFTYNESTAKWSVKADTKNPVTVYSTTEDNKLYTEGWIIGATSAPTTYLAYAYKDFYITLDEDLKWPAKAEISFDGQGTEASPYLLKTAADFNKLSQLVAEGNTFDGVYFKVTADIDFSSIEEYYAIGDSGNYFGGVLDGDNHTLSNLSFNGEGFLGTGLFGYTAEKSVVKNLNITKFVLQTQGTYLGTIAGINYGTIENVHVTSTSLVSSADEAGGIAGMSYGTIRETSFQGAVQGAGSVAGIVAQAMGTIDKCYVKANVTGTSYSTYSHDVAGIAGVLQKGTLTNSWATGALTDSYGRDAVGGLVARAISSTIKECFTTASISAKRIYSDTSGSGDCFTSGLVGSANDVVMEDCYSSSTIVKAGPYSSEYVGGIVGYLSVSYISSTAYEGTKISGVSTIKNCYFSGVISSSSSNTEKGLYGSTYIYSGYTGASPAELSFTNCHYDRQISIIGEDNYGRNTSYFTNGLPEGYDSSVWEAKTGYYPTLKNTGAGTQAQVMASAPLVLQDNQVSSKVKGYFNVTPATDVTWGILYSSSIVNESDALTYADGKMTVKDKYANSTIVAQTADGWAYKMYLISVVPKVFDGEGTAESPYLIKSASDLSKLNDAVSTYSQGHIGDYFAMTNDIDCTVTDDVQFYGVGYGTTNGFGGTFDGKNYSIKNLKINGVVYDEDGKALSSSSTSYLGLFGVTLADATIKNVVIDKSCQFTFYSASAPVVGYNQGVVDNCRNHADVISVGATTGGVVAYNAAGTIQNCYNSGRINSGTSQVGGITSYNTNEGVISGCQNDGVVIGQSNNASNASVTNTVCGGITGYNYGKVELCVNNGYVEADNTVGGIIARNSGGTIYGNLNNGIVASRNDTQYRGAVIGYLHVDGTISNNYYDSSVTVIGGSTAAEHSGITGLSTSELVAGVCPAELKSLGADEIFDFTANAYPVLKQFVNEEGSKAMRKIFVAFQPKTKRTNVTTTVALSPESGIEWKLSQNDAFKIDGTNLTVSTPTDMKVLSDTLSASYGDYAKVYNLSSLPVILEGEGTAESPYLIKTKNDWNNLADFVFETGWDYADNYFKVANDIDFENDSIHAIAVGGTSFQGIFDGANHVIKNYVYKNTNSVTTASKWVGPNKYYGKYIGLFGTLGALGEIKNLIVNGDFESIGYIGGICGNVYGKISNSIHRGNVHNSSGDGVSGIACKLYTGGVIEDCVNEGKVTAKTTKASGIVQESQVGSIIQRCYNRGTVVSTTTSTSGIANKVSGGILDCVNERPLTGTSSLNGIAMTLDSTAYAERCVNKVDFVTSVSYVVPLFKTLTTRYNSNNPEHVPATGGYVKDCYNEGNIQGKAYIYGLIDAVGAGWTIRNCHNTGNVTATSGLATGLFNTVGSTSSSSASVNHIALVDSCYNTGKVTGTAAKTAGLMSSLYHCAHLTNSYNLGDVVCNCTAATNTSGAGLAGICYGVIENCFNAGNVTTGGFAAGGLVGYTAKSITAAPVRISNSFNVGDVETTGAVTSTNGSAGGLIGYMSTSTAENYMTVENCYNAGNVKGPNRVAGLIAGMFQSYNVVKNCYNSGQVTCTDSTKISDAGVYRYLQSGTIYTNNYTQVVNGDTILMLNNCQNCFYDKNRFPGIEFRSVKGSPKTTSQLVALNISDAYQLSNDGGYPVLKDFANLAASEKATIAILLTDESAENSELVKNAVKLIAPEGTTWTQAPLKADGTVTTGEDGFTIENGVATPKATGKFALIATTKDNLVKTFKLNVEASADGVSSTFADKEVKNVIYVDLQGRLITVPVPGNVYIVRTNYVDGTYSVAKVIAK